MAKYECYAKKYVASYGETWESISMDFYGTPYKIAELISCNPKYSDVLIFEENTKLFNRTCFKRDDFFIHNAGKNRRTSGYGDHETRKR